MSCNGIIATSATAVLVLGILCKIPASIPDILIGVSVTVLMGCFSYAVSSTLNG